MTRKLDRLNDSNSSGLAFKRLWQKNCEIAEANTDDLQSQIDNINDILTRLTANEVATTAAQSTANTVTLNDAISVSYPAPGDVLSAADAGTDVTITVADHTRIYGDHTDVAVTGAAITGLAYSTDYYVYYDDAARAGGTVSYIATTNANAAMPNAASGRHYIGDLVTPAAGGTATSGGTSPPSSGGTVDKSDIHSTL